MMYGIYLIIDDHSQTHVSFNAQHLTLTIDKFGPTLYQIFIAVLHVVLMRHHAVNSSTLLTEPVVQSLYSSQLADCQTDF